MIVLDTHVLVWAMENHRYLGINAAKLIDEAIFSDGAFVPAITCWEISMLVDKKKLEFRQGVRVWIEEALSKPGMFLAPITPEIGADAGQLPGNPHGDPADRLVIATARAIGCSLLTADEAILAYAAAGHLQVIDAKR